MVYGQGKDPNAQIRKFKGSGWESVGQFIGGAINVGFGANNGDMNKVAQGVNQMGSSVQGFANKVAQNKQISSGSLNPNSANAAVPTKPGWGGPSQVSDPNDAVPDGQAGKAASTSMDMGAGYNPQSETFRSGSGQTITDRNKTFEQQATDALMKDNTLMAAKGRRINYLSFFN